MGQAGVGLARRIAGALLGLAGLTAGALAAPPPAKAPATAKPAAAKLDDDPMRVVIVQTSTPGCEPDCPRWIAAQGTIDDTTPAAFTKAIRQMGKERLPVFIQSRGGQVEASMAVGRILRKARLTVVIGTTRFQGCAPDDPKCGKARDFLGYRGQISPYGAYCASACSYLIAGGEKRLASAFSLVGVHQMTTIRTQVQRQYREYWRLEGGQRVLVKREVISEKTVSTKRETAKPNDAISRRLGKYLVEMGVSDSLITIANASTPDQMHWLTLTERQTTNLITESGFGDDLISRPKAAVALRAAVAPVAHLIADEAQVGPVQPAPAPAE